MENPAVVFSAEGFKMFLDFVKEVQQPATTEKEELSADEIVQKYFKRSSKPAVIPTVNPDFEDEPEVEETPPVSYDMDQVAQALVNYMASRWNRVFNNAEIHQILGAHGFAYSMRAIAPVMRGVLNRSEEIVKVEGGYVYKRDEVAEEVDNG
jgi:hypothetical protein